MIKDTKFETIGELFCGPGGGGIGASMAEFENGQTKFLPHDCYRHINCFCSSQYAGDKITVIKTFCIF